MKVLALLISVAAAVPLSVPRKGLHHSPAASQGNLQRTNKSTVCRPVGLDNQLYACTDEQGRQQLFRPANRQPLGPFPPWMAAAPEQTSSNGPLMSSSQQPPRRVFPPMQQQHNRRVPRVPHHPNPSFSGQSSQEGQQGNIWGNQMPTFQAGPILMAPSRRPVVIPPEPPFQYMHYYPPYFMHPPQAPRCPSGDPRCTPVQAFPTALDITCFVVPKKTGAENSTPPASDSSSSVEASTPDPNDEVQSEYSSIVPVNPQYQPLPIMYKPEFYIN